MIEHAPPFQNYLLIKVGLGLLIVLLLLPSLVHVWLLLLMIVYSRNKTTYTLATNIRARLPRYSAEYF